MFICLMHIWVRLVDGLPHWSHSAGSFSLQASAMLVKGKAEQTVAP